MGTWPGTYSFPSHGVPQICRYAYGVRSNIPHAPASRTVFGRPSRVASYGHMIIQCGPMGMAGLVLSNGSVLLGCVEPHSMEMIPGAVFVGAGLPAMI